MKVLKVILFIILGLVGIFVILGLVGPKSYDVSRTAVVQAPISQVWPWVSSLPKTSEWSPWAGRDTNMVIEYTGTEGTLGSASKWESKKMGKGEQTITAIDPGKSVESELKFYMPWGVGVADSYTMLQDTAGVTKVTWGIRGKNDFVSRIFGVFMNMDKMMGKDFEEGLANLQMKATEPMATDAGFDIVTGDFPGAKYLGVRATITMDKMEAFYSENLEKVFDELGKAGIQPASAPTGLYFSWDMEKMSTDMAAGAAFAGDLKATPQGLTVFDVPAAKSLTINYMGGYYGLGAAHEAMDAYMKANKVEQIAPVLEEYLTDPMSEPDSAKWHTKITYLLK